LLFRGQELNSSRPTFYAVSISRVGIVSLIEVVQGRATVLASVRARDWPQTNWLKVRIEPQGEILRVVVQRMDTDEFLATSGKWEATPRFAIQAIDSSIRGDGHVGVQRTYSSAGQVLVDDFTLLKSSSVADQSFDTLPRDWDFWGSASLGVTNSRSVSGASLISGGNSQQASRFWIEQPVAADVLTSVSVFADSLVPAEVITRGRNLGSIVPTYYSASVVRGTIVTVRKVVNGVATVLGSVQSATYASGVWLDLLLISQGSTIQVRLMRKDTGQWLTPRGEWQASPAAALTVQDSSISTSGHVGIGRVAAYAGSVHLDDFRVRAAAEDVIAPVVTAALTRVDPSPTPRTFAGVMRVIPVIKEKGRIRRVDMHIDGTLFAQRTAAPFAVNFDPRDYSNGKHHLAIRAWDEAGNLGEATRDFSIQNRIVMELPAIPRHYDHIRYASLAYNGTTLGPAEVELLRESVDLVVPNSRYLTTIDHASPSTPQLIYSNVSNLYLDLLTDWLDYSDQKRHQRENAFYHVSSPTLFMGDSPSSMPVNWFWNVQRGLATGSGPVTRLTAESRSASAGDVRFGSAGEFIYLGAPDRFAELNVQIARGAGSNWRGVLEYVSRIDATGKVTEWKSMPAETNRTNGFRSSGQIGFIPPRDWKAALLPGSAARFFYVRIRTLAGSESETPIASTILGRDYVNANGRTSGIIPAYDDTADRDNDGFLSDAEYASRRSGFNARFPHESRLFFPYYGQMRFVTNPIGQGVAAWAGDYHRRFLNLNPLADGILMDNSGGRAPINGALLVESTDTYASDYGAVLGAVKRAIAPRWVLANTSGGGTEADGVARRTPGTIEEFALRPLAHTWSHFRDLADTVSRRLRAPAGYLILDTLSTGGSPTDPRTRTAALAYYYLLSDPDRTMLMTWGGEEPASAWSRHWFDAIAFDVGRPKSALVEYAAGTDPANQSLTYRVFHREFDNAIVLYKPLSYAALKGIGSLTDFSATTHRLSGEYRLLHSDGTLGPVTTFVTLRNGEGAILIRA
jgi:hypothetical protein